MSPYSSIDERLRLSRIPLDVLVVDDSAVVRQILTTILERDRKIHVTVAADPIIAMEKMKRSRPQVIVLDLTMPRMDGLTFLRKLMAEDPIPVIICSALTAEGSQAALTALHEGAVDIVAKPALGVADFLEESAAEFLEKVRCAATAKVSKRRASMHLDKSQRLPPRPTPMLRRSSPAPESQKVVAVGASTGGTEALGMILSTLPPDSPGMLIVQHMPAAFTGPLARHLNSISGIEVHEARDGDMLREGTALIAPGHSHMVLRRAGDRYLVSLNKGPRVSRHRPSVDVLFRSVAEVAAQNAIGVILTGMGEDGAEGMYEMNVSGATTIAQSAESCVVFGMPRQAISRGAVDEILPLSKISAAILRNADRKPEI